MATRQERLNALQESLDKYVSGEKKRIDNEVAFLKSVLKGRTGKEVLDRSISTVGGVAYKDIATYLFGDADVAFGTTAADIVDDGESVSTGNGSPSMGSSSDLPATMNVVGYKGGSPVDLVVVLADYETGRYLSSPAAAAFKNMKAAASGSGVSLRINLGFRTMKEQEKLWVLKGKDTRKVARPGYSNHQMGLSADIFVNKTLLTGPGKWLSQNASRFKFVNDVSGEPWHWTYTP